MYTALEFEAGIGNASANCKIVHLNFTPKSDCLRSQKNYNRVNDAFQMLLHTHRLIPVRHTVVFECKIKSREKRIRQGLKNM